MNTVANGNDSIEVIDLCWAILVLSIMQKMHITLFQLTFFKSFVYVTCYDRLVFLKQFCHLSLR